MGFLETIVIVLIILKCVGVLHIGWLWCFSPLLAYPIFFLLWLIFSLTMIAIVAFASRN
jgi:hypothetical protein